MKNGFKRQWERQKKKKKSKSRKKLTATGKNQWKETERRLNLLFSRPNLLLFVDQSTKLIFV